MALFSSRVFDLGDSIQYKPESWSKGDVAMKRVMVCLKVLAVLFAVALTGGCSNATNAGTSAAEQSSSAASQVKLVDCALIKDDDFGGIYLDISIEDFNALGFTFGDGIDVAFSNGYSLTDIPYYNGYYAASGTPQACGYPGYENVLLNNAQGPSLWEQAGVSEGETATVVLTDPGKYLDVQEVFSLSYSTERSDYPDDAVFANFRELSGGTLKEGLLYRSASPVDNTYNRAPYVNNLAKNADVRFVLNLADSDEEIAGLIKEDQEESVDISYFLELYDKGSVAPLNLDSDFMSPSFATTLANGLRELTSHEGPYLIHCLEGKDRTGFVCMLLESLAGATYDELLDDYMISYANYYGITQENDPDRYSDIELMKFDDILVSFTHAEGVDDLKTKDYVAAARTYLRDGGMTDEEIDRLAEVICRTGI